MGGELLGVLLYGSEVFSAALALEGVAEAPRAAGVPNAEDESGDLGVAVLSRLKTSDIAGCESHARMVAQRIRERRSRARGNRHPRLDASNIATS